MLQVFLIEPQGRTASLLKTQKQVCVAATANSINGKPSRGDEFDLILVSASLPRSEVLDFLRKQRDNGARSVVIDVTETDGEVVPFLEAGAAGYVPTGVTANQMVSILAAVADGKPPVAPTVGTALVERMHELLALEHQRAGEALLENCPDPTTLTAREREILTLIRAGASNQAIANELMIELGTVKNHVHNILKKLNVTRREQAASYVELLELRPRALS